MSKKTSDRAVVVLAVGKHGRTLLEITGASLKAYATKIGADFHVIDGDPIQPDYPFEDKFRVGQYLNYYDRIVYFDADVMVEENAPNLFDLVPYFKIGIANEELYELRPMYEPHDLTAIQEQYKFKVVKPPGYYNAGIMVLSKAHKDVMAPPTLPYRKYHTAEQDLINCRILEYGHPVHDFGPDLVWLWFTDQEQVRQQGRPFQHFAGATTLGPGHLSVMKGPIQRSYLINLKRRPDRLEESLKEMNKAGIRPVVFPAVDGSALPLPQGWKDGAGAYGCLESHKRVLENAILDGLECIAVFEDDAVFTDNYQEKLAHLVRQAPKDWDMLYVGGQHRQTPKPIREGVVRCTDCHRTHAYIVRGHAIKRLYQIWSSNQGHADHILGRGYFDELRAYAADPWLCGQGASVSDINGREAGERWWDTPRKPVTKAIDTNEKGCNCKKTADTRRRLQAMKGRK